MMLLTASYSPTSACSTCAILLRNITPPSLDESKEKSIPFDEKYSEKLVDLPHYQSECCERYVCSICVEKNPRFITYCPFCPIKRPFSESQDQKDSTENDPPPYTALPTSPPPYPSATARDINSSTSLIHYLLPVDSLTAISLQYSIPPAVLRTHNRLYSDSLLAGRSYVLIPRSHYSGPSLSPNPVQSEEDNVLKRFQVRTKCVEYEIAKVYLDESQWDLEKAVEKWVADERWEAQNGDIGSSSRVRAGKAGAGRGAGSAGLRKGFFR